MIKSFKHKGLETLFTTGNTKGVRQYHVKRLRNILAKLDSATDIEDMMYPGSRHAHSVPSSPVNVQLSMLRYLKPWVSFFLLQRVILFFFISWSVL